MWKVAGNLFSRLSRSGSATESASRHSSRSTRSRSISNDPLTLSNREGIKEFQRRPQLFEVLSPSTPDQIPLPAEQLLLNKSSRGNRAQSYSPRQYGFDEEHNNNTVPFNQQFPHDTIVVYTDGSCVDNRASGFGIYFGDGHPLNMSRAIRGREHNSGLAEITAAQTALDSLLHWDEYKGQYVILRTDYLALITAMNKGNNGRFAAESVSKMIISKYDKLREIAAEFPKGVEFQHVKGHANDPGNEMADQLAGQATCWASQGKRSRSVSPTRGRSRERTNRKQQRSRSVSLNRPESELRAFVQPAEPEDSQITFGPQSTKQGASDSGSSSGYESEETENGRSRSRSPSRSRRRRSRAGRSAYIRGGHNK